MSGWTGSTRRLRLPPGWAQIRIQRLRLDGFRCQILVAPGVICGAPATDVDHIQAMTDDHSLEALRSLCGPHHRAKSANEGGTASGAQAKRRAQARYRPSERHPGLV
jgi:5-methylcytosine-specific restriction enzyme A